MFCQLALKPWKGRSGPLTPAPSLYILSAKKQGLLSTLISLSLPVVKYFPFLLSLPLCFYFIFYRSNSFFLSLLSFFSFPLSMRSHYTCVTTTVLAPSKRASNTRSLFVHLICPPIRLSICLSVCVSPCLSDYQCVRNRRMSWPIFFCTSVWKCRLKPDPDQTFHNFEVLKSTDRRISSR